MSPQPIIDCDLHNTVPSAEALLPYLSAHWREYISQSAFKGPVDTAYPPGAPTSARPDATPAEGGPPGSSLALLQEQVLDTWNVEFGILNCTYAVESLHNPDAAAAMSSAVNEWQIAEWLEKEPRLRASLVVPSHYPDLAAREIERRGNHPGFIQVFLPIRSAAPYGNRRYWPIYEAAVRHNLVIGLHFGGSPGTPPTPAGWPSYYIEEYAGMSQIFQSQVISLIAEGVFDQFPALRVALIEGGFTWLPSLMWRMDKEWKGLRREIPWVKRLPSEYIRQHLRLTLQPVDPPPDPDHLLQIIKQLESDDMLMFSTDYPHWHLDTPEEALPVALSPEVKRKIMAENARAFYRL
ncbi:MAG TPA: amidohydrolase family protein [Anaerolineae bacterium]|nr:amidohydrolase family protein [Anaerolineae bacterium]